MVILPLSFACELSDRTLALYTGDVRPDSIQLNFTAQLPEVTFVQQMSEMRYDVSEMSLSAYVGMRASGRHDFLALPVFSSRMFRHSSLYVRTDSDIESPADLHGKRVGLGFYQMTGAVWTRGFMLDDYRIAAKDIIWVSGKENDSGAGADQVAQLQNLLSGIHSDKPKLEQMLEDGEIDALLSVHTPRALARNEGGLRHLFRNCREVEEDYFRRTRIFPMMHAIVIKQRLHEEQPWVAQSLFDAFTASKNRALERLFESTSLAAAVPSLFHDVARIRTIMGTDYWPFGIEPNRGAMETFLRHMRDQGIITVSLKPEDLFIDLHSSS